MGRNLHEYVIATACYVGWVDGRNQSVLNDAWAKSAQIVSLPLLMSTRWDMTDMTKVELKEELENDCGGFTVHVSVNLLRDNPMVGKKMV